MGPLQGTQECTHLQPKNKTKLRNWTKRNGLTKPKFCSFCCTNLKRNVLRLFGFALNTSLSEGGWLTVAALILRLCLKVVAGENVLVCVFLPPQTAAFWRTPAHPPTWGSAKHLLLLFRHSGAAMRSKNSFCGSGGENICDFCTESQRHDVEISQRRQTWGVNFFCL